MIFEDFTPHVERDGERPSRLILFPFATFESFCRREWVGRESEWFRIYNVLHWTLSYDSFDPATKLLLLQPDSPHLFDNLSAHLDEDHIIVVTSDADEEESFLAGLEQQSPASLDLILATGVFGTGAGPRDETHLLRACQRALKTGGYLLATFPLQDVLGNPQTAQNIQLLDAATSVGFEQDNISGCDGIAHHLGGDFWAGLRKQGRPAFETMLHAFAQISDDPSALWMSRTAFYAGIKR